MSTNNIFTNLPKNDKKILILIVLVMVFLVGSIVGITSYYAGKQNNKLNKSPIPVVDASQISDSSKILGQQIYNWTGQITEIQQYYLKFNTDIKQPDGSHINKNITAYVDKNTKIIKWDLSNTKNDPTVDNKTTINYSDLHIGDQIIVKSTNGLDENYETNASDINLLITP